MSRMTAPVGEVTTPTTLGRNGILRFRRLIEQALLGELLAPRLEQRHQRADAGEFELLDDDLVARFAGKGRQPPVATTSSPSSGLTFIRRKAVRQITASSRALASLRQK